MTATPTMPTARSGRFERYANWFAWFCVAALLFLPLILISHYQSVSPNLPLDRTGEATVGMGVLLRAAIRRLFSNASGNIVRSTFGTFFKAGARTLTRQSVKMFTHYVLGIVWRQAFGSDAAETKSRVTTFSQVTSLLMGFVVLCFSFLGVLSVVGFDRFTLAFSHYNISVLSACILAGLPILVYCWLAYRAAWKLGVPIRFATDLDGILIQGYFTGAGSFLPMTTDLVFEGTVEQKAKVATRTLIGMFLVHLLLLLAAWLSGYNLLEFVSSMFLLYCFVYSFPIQPLEGHDIWAHSKLRWACVWLPILLSFLMTFPTGLAELLSR